MEGIDVFEVLAQGATAEIIDWGSDRVLKRFYSGFTRQRVMDEAARQRTAFDAGLPVPELVEVIQTDNDCWGIVMEKAPQTNIIDVCSSQSQMLDFMVMLQRRIHNVDVLFPTMRAKLETSLFQSKLPLDNMSLALRKLQEIPVGQSACHFDFKTSHILGDGRQWWIVDWAEAVVGHPRADVCRTWMMLELWKPDTAEMYRQRWSDLGYDDFEDWLPILAAIRLLESRPAMENIKLRSWVRTLI